MEGNPFQASSARILLRFGFGRCRPGTHWGLPPSETTVGGEQGTKELMTPSCSETVSYSHPFHFTATRAVVRTDPEPLTLSEKEIRWVSQTQGAHTLLQQFPSSVSALCPSPVQRSVEQPSIGAMTTFSCFCRNPWVAAFLVFLRLCSPK